MTLREKLIEDAAKAILRASLPEGTIEAFGEPQWKDWDGSRETDVRRATAALDAILSGLSEPSEEMVFQGADVIGMRGTEAAMDWKKAEATGIETFRAMLAKV
jgi:hypothetical protein